MVQITEIKPQKNQKRVNIYLDGKFEFGIDLYNFAKLDLRVGLELSEKDITEIVKKSEFQKTLDYLLKFATLRPRSDKEIRDWLKRKKIHESIHKDLFNRLNRLELIDDRKFARWWINQRQEFSPRGSKALFYELKSKGISDEIINEVLGETEVDEVKVARELLARKDYKWQLLSEEKSKQKKVQFLARKGFDWEIIEKAVKKINRR